MTELAKAGKGTRMPFLWLLFPFTAGILLASYTKIQETTVLWVCLSLFVILLLERYTNAYIAFRFSFVKGLFLQVLFASCGYWITQQGDIRTSPYWFASSSVDPALYVAVVETAPEARERSFASRIRFVYIVGEGRKTKARGSCPVYFSRQLRMLPQSGDTLLFTRKPAALQPGGNPGSFDYRNYAARKNWYHQLYLDSNSFTVLPGKHQSSSVQFQSLLNSIQQRLVLQLKTHIPDSTAAGLAAALLIGYKEDLDPLLMQAYANTGVSHIVAISGMHLGLIYVLLSFLFRWIPLPKRMHPLRTVAVLLGLWFFSFLAGGGPSVLRAAVMFTFLSGEQWFTRKIPSLNGLAASAFVLLAIYPQWLYDAGFQLSYSAVLSILLFYKPLYQLIYFKNRFLDFIWKLNAVTLAAQLLTLPVSLYYFHQFPVYFLFANLIAVPLSSGLLFAALLLEAIAFSPVLSHAVGWLLGNGILWMNASISFFDQLPFALWRPLWVSLPQVLLLYLVLLGWGRFWLLQKKSGLYLLLLSLIAFAGVRTASFLQILQQPVLVIYQSRKEDLADLFSEREWTALGSESGQRSPQTEKVLTACREKYRTRKGSDFPSPAGTSRIFQLNHHIVVQIDQAFRDSLPVITPQPFILWLCRGARLDLRQFLLSCPVQEVVIGPGHSLSRIRKWKNECLQLGISCHPIVEKGAFVKPLR